MEITDYTDLITLERAKTYLRIDDGMNEDDEEIYSMIRAAFTFIERYTNHIFGNREFSVYNDSYCSQWIKVYKYPVNSFLPANTESKRNGLYTSFNVSTDVNFTYKAGYINVGDVPDDFIQAALQMLKVWYYESEKQANSTLIPISVTQVLDTYRTFV